MKFLVAFALIALAAAAPQPKKLFHEHFEDFLDVIEQEAGHELAHIMGHYMEFEEFRATVDYMASKDFKEIIYEMESLPEFVAMVEYLEEQNIDILYFIDRLNSMFEEFNQKKARSTQRHELSGTNFSAFTQDMIAVFPKDKLAALYEEKIEEDEKFRTAMENLKSDEWKQVFTALLDSETFQKEAQLLEQNGVELEALFDELVAIFGQN